MEEGAVWISYLQVIGERDPWPQAGPLECIYIGMTAAGH